MTAIFSRSLLCQIVVCVRPVIEFEPALVCLSAETACLQGLQVGFTGELGYHKVSPRKLLSTHLNQMVSVMGIVTKCTLVHPKLVKSVHYCQATNKFSTRHFSDEADISAAPSMTNAIPTKDENQNLLTTESGLCSFVDNQRITLQELPETAPPGQLPRSTGMHHIHRYIHKHVCTACMLRAVVEHSMASCCCF